MTEKSNCPECGAALAQDAPRGLCAACLLQAGLEQNELSQGATRAAMPTPEELAEILPDLEILECIGAGGMGVVYRARQPGLDREVAVKILSPDVADSADFADRFSREARALATLSHPNIVAVHDFGQAGGLCYIVMELVVGTDLRQVMRAGGLDPKQALSIVPKLCDALQYAHDRGVVHRDIKPENVLLTEAGEIKIVDFGLAKSIRGSDQSTVTGRAMGTPAYMAPEQVERPETVDHRADIFSLGVVFYEMLTGELPLGRFAPPSEKVAVDVRLDEVVLRTLEKERELRYQRAADVKTDIDAVGAGGEPSRCVRSASPAAEPHRRGPGFYITVIGGCAVLLVTAFLLMGVFSAMGVPRLLLAVDRGKVKRTIADLRTISESAEAYRAASGVYPVAMSIDELQAALVPAHADALPKLDGWGRKFIVLGESTTFTVGSGGKDGGALDLVDGGGETEQFEDAIVFVNNVPVQWSGDLHEPAEGGIPIRGMGFATLTLILLGTFFALVAAALLIFVARSRRRRMVHR